MFLMKINKIFNGQPPVKVYKLKSSDGYYWPKGEHNHEYMQIWYVIKGSCEHLVENGVYRMEQNSLLVIPPLVSHEVKNSSEDCEILGCEFPLEIVMSDNIVEKYSNASEVVKFAYVETFESIIKCTKPKYQPSKPCRMEVEQLLNSMLDTYSKKEMFYEVVLKADLLKLLVAISRDYAKTVEDTKSVAFTGEIENAIEYIKAHYNEKIFIADISKQTTMCISYFSYFFKEHTGKTFIEYVNSLRLEKAKELLTSTNETLENISQKVGFNDCTYFMRVFKSEEKISPGKYRIKMAKQVIK